MKVIVRSFSAIPRLVLVRDAFRERLEVNQMLEPNTKITLDVEPGKEIWLADGNLFSFDDNRDRVITITDSVEGAGFDPVFQVEVMPRRHYDFDHPPSKLKGAYGTHMGGYSGGRSIRNFIGR